MKSASTTERLPWGQWPPGSEFALAGLQLEASNRDGKPISVTLLEVLNEGKEVKVLFQRKPYRVPAGRLIFPPELVVICPACRKPAGPEHEDCGSPSALFD